MARKSTEPKSYLSAEGGGVAPAPAKRKRTARVKSAAKAQPAEATAAAAPVAGQTEKAFAAGSSAVSSGPIAEREEIARLAYLYWEARQGQGGSAEEDWLRAEEEVRIRRASAAQ